MFSAKIVTKLQQKKYRQEFGCFVVEGKRAVADALASEQKILQLIITDRFARENREFLSSKHFQSHKHSQGIMEVGEVAFSKMMDTVTPQGIAAVMQLPKTSLSKLKQSSLIVVLEDIRDPGNLGTMIRTADWYGVDGMLLVGGADAYQPKVVRASMGSLFHVPIITSVNLSHELRELKNLGFSLVVTRPESPNSFSNSHQKSSKQCLVFGNEAEGTSDFIDAMADASIAIPKFGQAESLNVAVSFGIVMYELRRPSL